MPAELNKLIIELLTGFVYGAAIGGVIAIFIVIAVLWQDIKDGGK